MIDTPLDSLIELQQGCLTAILTVIVPILYIVIAVLLAKAIWRLF